MKKILLKVVWRALDPPTQYTPPFLACVYPTRINVKMNKGVEHVFYVV